ncbi:hypothetical protein BDZ91DRAFT_799824 [Kalaharituber pfeilii]|nr:hypothetical protein BDZ91DRAFT_799824 [Kalaharituber pfeilii]
MDPVSLASGVAGFLALSMELVKLFTQYTSDLVEFQEQDEIKGSVNYGDDAVLRVIITNCETIIRGLYSTLVKLNVDAPGGSKFNRLLFPLKKQDCLQMAETLHRYTQILQFSLTITSCAMLSKTSREVSVVLSQQKALLKAFTATNFEIQAQVVKQNGLLTNVPETYQFTPKKQQTLQECSSLPAAAATAVAAAMVTAVAAAVVAAVVAASVASDSSSGDSSDGSSNGSSSGS